MRNLRLGLVALHLLWCTTGLALSGTTSHTKPVGESLELAPVRRESTVTRVGAAQEMWGVGRVNIHGFPPVCDLEDSPGTTMFGALAGSSHGAWVAWDLAAVPSYAEVIRVEIEHELTPDLSNDPGLRLVYRRMGSDCMPPPDCSATWECMYSCPAYTDVEMGTSAGLRRYVLGGSAVDDVEGQVAGEGFLCVGLSVDYLDSLIGTATFSGWASGGPELLVTWRDPSAVEPASWGTIKALFKP